MSPHGHLRMGVGLMAAAAAIAARNMQVAAATGSSPLAVTSAEVRALAGNFAFNGRFLPRSSTRKTGIAAQRRAARKRRNQLREKRRG